MHSNKRTLFLTLLALPLSLSATASERPDQLLWGDTHLHTNLSPDAYVNKNTTVGPDTAYRFARGMAVISDDTRAKVKLETPLDFLAVTDHAEYAGIPKLLWEGDAELAATKTGARYIEMIGSGNGTEVFFELIGDVNSGKPNPDVYSEKVRNQIWHDIVDAAEANNKPGEFTALIGWEWSSLPNGANLHRVVMIPEGGDVAKQFTPYSAFDSDVPEDFWAWLEKTSEATGASFLAIPHGSNISNGLMFQETDSSGAPISGAYAKARIKWEPLAEITQIKGDSETKAALSPNDEFADFETYEHLITTDEGAGGHADMDEVANYVRPAMVRGLEIEARIGTNPYKFGVVGSTDAHTGLASTEEPNFWGKFSLDSKPDGKNIEGVPGVTGWDMSASGLAAVWATENTRGAIIDAMRRKEVYGTSGPRIQLRMFAGYHFSKKDLNAADWVDVGYKKGVPMGGDLNKADRGQKPGFLIRAAKDPKEANLDRVQVVKGWLDEGKPMEKVFDVAWSEGRKMSGGKLEPVGNTVDTNTALWTNDIGAAELSVFWEDPEFKANQSAFYYVRVLQIPTPRHTLFDSVALQQPHPEGYDKTIQERAYSSAVWYTP